MQYVYYLVSLMEEKHLDYLMSLMAKKGGESKQSASLHDMYVELNRLAGMYWIVCSCCLLGRLAPKLEYKVTRIKEKFNQQLKMEAVVFDELGGPLRTLSFVQLVELLIDSESERQEIYRESIIPQLIEFIAKYIQSPLETHLPFWFDMRGIYCLCVCLLLTGQLEAVSDIHRSCLIDYIYRSQAILGGFGARPHSEAHGGYTFCAIATLQILKASVPNSGRLSVWLSKRLAEMNGRLGKPRDSCYLWWIGASLINLGKGEVVLVENKSQIELFLRNNCFVPDSGGISKYPSIPWDDKSVHGKQDADLFHTFLGIASLALMAGLIDPITVLPKSLP